MKKYSTKEVKLINKVAKLFLFAGLVVWILNTTIFLIIEGWQLKGTHPTEIYLDRLTINLLSVWLHLYIYIIFNLIFIGVKKNSLSKRLIRKKYCKDYGYTDFNNANITLYSKWLEKYILNKNQ